MQLVERKLYIKTYGCQMNVYDSERMKELFVPFGYKIVDDYKGSDLVILNTCHIREKATEKVYSELGRIYKANKEKKPIIAVAGCVAQAEGKAMIKRAPYVDVVVGPQSYHILPSLVADINKHKKINKVALDFVQEEKFDLLPEKRTSIDNNVSAFVSIQEGCDKFCTYCVVPYTRGAEFSRPVQKIIDETKLLVDQGAKEITLLGQNVNAYHGIDGKKGIMSLGGLIMELNKINDLERIRYVTSHPQDMHNELYEAHASCFKLMPFLHLPVQSGSDRILKLMNRKHNAESYLKIIEKLKVARPDLAFSSDFIVGFPEETEEDFMATLEIAKKVEYGQCFSFKYSPRPGTPAALSENQIKEEIKSERLARLKNLLDEKQLQFNKKFFNKNISVLFDRQSDDTLIGRSEYLQVVTLKKTEQNKNYLNQIKKVKVSRSGMHSLEAK